MMPRTLEDELLHSSTKVSPSAIEPPRRSLDSFRSFTRLKESLKLFARRGRGKKSKVLLEKQELELCLDPPRFSCDGIGESRYLCKEPPRRSLDSRFFLTEDAPESRYLCEEPPRRSLDSRIFLSEVDAAPLLEPPRRSLDVQMFCKTYFTSEDGFKERKQTRNVVAKLMGLEDLPGSTVAVQRKTSTLRDFLDAPELKKNDQVEAARLRTVTDSIMQEGKHRQEQEQQQKKWRQTKRDKEIRKGVEKKQEQTKTPDGPQQMGAKEDEKTRGEHSSGNEQKRSCSRRLAKPQHMEFGKVKSKQQHDKSLLRSILGLKETNACKKQNKQETGSKGRLEKQDAAKLSENNVESKLRKNAVSKAQRESSKLNEVKTTATSRHSIQNKARNTDEAGDPTKTNREQTSFTAAPERRPCKGSSLMRPTIASSARQQVPKTAKRQTKQKQTKPSSIRDRSESRAALANLKTKSPAAKVESTQSEQGKPSACSDASEIKFESKKVTVEKITSSSQFEGPEVQLDSGKYPRLKGGTDTIMSDRLQVKQKEEQVLALSPDTVQGHHHHQASKGNADVLSPVSVLDAYEFEETRDTDHNPVKLVPLRPLKFLASRILDFGAGNIGDPEPELCCEEHWTLTGCKRCSVNICSQLENAIFDNLVYETMIHLNAHHVKTAMLFSR